MIIYIIFSDDERRKIEKLIKNFNYEEIRNICVIKLSIISESIIAQEKLNDFMTYLANVISNYRSFKIQLREANILEKDYLTYQIEQWEILHGKDEKYKNMVYNRYFSVLGLDIGIPKVIWLVNSILIQNYILRFGTRFNHGELINSRVYIYHGNNRKVVVISKEDETMENSIFLDITGEMINDISENELVEIKEKNMLVWKADKKENIF